MRIDDPRLKESGPKLTQALVDAYLKQFFSVGVYHGDSHPGNLFIMEDGRICLHDFGLFGFLDRNTRRHLAAFMRPSPCRMRNGCSTRRSISDLLARGADRAEFSGRLEELLQDYVQLPLREWSFAEALLRITRMSEGQQVRMPRNLLVLTRTLFLMESTVRTLDPGFDLMDGLLGKGAVAPKNASDGGGENDGRITRLKYEMAIALRQIPEQLASLLRKARAGQIGTVASKPCRQTSSARAAAWPCRWSPWVSTSPRRC